jgi:hypothetical protein
MLDEVDELLWQNDFNFFPLRQLGGVPPFEQPQTSSGRREQALRLHKYAAFEPIASLRDHPITCSPCFEIKSEENRFSDPERRERRHLTQHPSNTQIYDNLIEEYRQNGSSSRQMLPILQEQGEHNPRMLSRI